MCIRPNVVLLVAVFFAALGSVSSTAVAIPADGSEALIREGLALRRNGDDEGALAKFNAALGIRRSGRALAQIALAEQAIGHWVESESHLKEALNLRDEAWIAKNRPLLETSLKEISSHLGALELTANVAGAVIKVNGVFRGRLPLPEPMRVPSGTVTVELEAEGYFPLARSVVLSSGGRAREAFTMVSASQSPPVSLPSFVPPSPPFQTPMVSDSSTSEHASESQPTSSWQRPTAYVALLGSAALLVYGGVAHWQREKIVRDEIKKAEEKQPFCSPTNLSDDCKGVRKQISDDETHMAIGYGGAAALAATGGLLFWLAPTTGGTSDVSSVALFAKGTF
jgi:tetratricopeptide (TPR) repeat protein